MSMRATTDESDEGSTPLPVATSRWRSHCSETRGFIKIQLYVLGGILFIIPSSLILSSRYNARLFSTQHHIRIKDQHQHQHQRIPKRSPHHVFWCGYENCFGQFVNGSNIAEAIFPEVNVTRLETLDNVTFQQDDVLVWPCGGFCPFPYEEFTTVFPGAILTINGESVGCGVNPREGAEHRIFSATRIDTDPLYHNASTMFVGVDVATRSAAVRASLLDPTKRVVNMGEHFLIYAYSHCVAFREEAFRQLAQIGPVHYGGPCSGGGVGERSKEVSLGGWGENDVLFRKYRFALVMENTAQDNYITEKIENAFYSGSIPIFYGTEQVFDLFNRKAFIWYDIHSPQEALDRVAYLERNVTAYKEMLQEPILAHGEETIAKYMSFRDNEGGGRLKWAIRERMGFG